mmetsp:Transcript_25235/g.55111  ORF Transcript_25235/g.55111 Transcript_25235/m.55111 type:complete len:119 (+) Transcript_25235:150-506(+)
MNRKGFKSISHHLLDKGSDLDKIFSFQVLGIARSGLAIDNTAATYAVKHRDLLLHVLEANAFTVEVCSVNVKDSVRDRAACLGDFLDNIEASIAKHIIDVAKNTRTVMTDNGKTDGVF